MRAAADRAAREEAVCVKPWNASLAAGQGTMWLPTIRAAVLAGLPWLDVIVQVATPAAPSISGRSIVTHGLDRNPGSRVALQLVLWLGGDADRHRASCTPARSKRSDAKQAATISAKIVGHLPRCRQGQVDRHRSSRQCMDDAA